MAATKLNQKQWAKLIEKGLKKHEYRATLSPTEKIFRKINKHKIVPIMVGVSAMMIYINIWGFKEFSKAVLTYLIILTVIATIVANLLNPKK
jgi:hypothetical protein